MKDFLTIKVLETSSTMDLARDLQLACPDFPVPFAVLARAQTAGRGRRGKEWIHHVGGHSSRIAEVSDDAIADSKDLLRQFAEIQTESYLSDSVDSCDSNNFKSSFFEKRFIDAMKGEADFLPVTFCFPRSAIKVPLEWFSIAAGCAIFDAACDLAVFLCSAFPEVFRQSIESPRRIFLKWPNDLVSGGSSISKIAGILVEAFVQGKNTPWVNLGIGLNFFESPESVPASSLIDVIFGGEGRSRAGGAENLGFRDARKRLEKWKLEKNSREVAAQRFLESLQTELFEYLCVARTVGQLRSLAVTRMMPLGTVHRVAEFPQGWGAIDGRLTSQQETNLQTGFDAAFEGLGDDGSLLLEGMLPLHAGEVSVQISQIAKISQSVSEENFRRNASEKQESVRDSRPEFRFESKTETKTEAKVETKLGPNHRPKIEPNIDIDKVTKKWEMLSKQPASSRMGAGQVSDAADWKLFLDVGNTRLHWGLKRGQSPVELVVGHIPFVAFESSSKLLMSHDSVRELLTLLQEHRRGVLRIFSFSVRRANDTKNFLQALFLCIESVFPEIKVTSSMLDADTMLSKERSLAQVFKNYGNKLGSDRALKIFFALRQAEKLNARVGILSLGTATTIEIVAPPGLTLGKQGESVSSSVSFGNQILLESMILPGIQMSFDALSERTAALPRLEYQMLTPGDFDLNCGQGTQASIARGAIFGAFHLCRSLCETHEVKKLWVCGGTAAHFFECVHALRVDDQDLLTMAELSENLGLEALALWVSEFGAGTRDARPDGFQPLLAHSLAASPVNSDTASVMSQSSSILASTFNDQSETFDEDDYQHLGEASMRMASSLFRGRKHYRARTAQEPRSEDFRRLGVRVETSGVGERIDRHLGMRFRFHSRVSWQQRIADGEVLVEHLASKIRYDDAPPTLEVVKHTYRMKPFDQVWMFQPPEYEPGFVNETKIVCDDGDAVAFHKPGNLVVHATGLYGRNTFLDVLEELGHKNVFPVHRIDRETSGILLCARNPETRRELADLFKENAMTKMYLAVVRNFADLPLEYAVEAAIGPAEQSLIRLKMWVGQGSDFVSARTHFVTVAKIGQTSLVLCFPETGRTNQIRVHLAAAGQWILGDKMYHPDENVFLDFFENGLSPALLKKIEIPRHALHNTAIFGRPKSSSLFTNGPVICPVSHDLMEFRLIRDLLEESGIGISEGVQKKELERLFIHYSEIHTGQDFPVYTLADLKEFQKGAKLNMMPAQVTSSQSMSVDKRGRQ